MASRKRMLAHLAQLSSCERCPAMHGPVVTGRPVHDAEVMLVGQAPGGTEGSRGRPFAHTAGKTLFGWLESALGVGEEQVRSRLWFSAVCRCFPGKKPGGGDRVPSREEVESCSPWLEAELALLRPRLVLPVGKLAISRFLPCEKLDGVVGNLYQGERGGARFDLLPLPHPSGASSWHRTEPGKTLLAAALGRLAHHPAARSLTLGAAAASARIR